MNFILQYAVEIFFGLVLSFIGYLYKQVNKYIKIIKKDEKTLKELIKYVITEKYSQLESKKKITISEKEMLNALYSKYECLGCDPFVEDLMERINHISTEES